MSVHELQEARERERELEQELARERQRSALFEQRAAYLEDALRRAYRYGVSASQRRQDAKAGEAGQ